jgi:hypothetical protein
MAEVQRMAVFALHHLTRHIRAVLDRAFRDYTAAYTALLHTWSLPRQVPLPLAVWQDASACSTAHTSGRSASV